MTLWSKECRRSVFVAAHAGVAPFFFAADDDLFDMACLATPDSVRRFCCRMGPLVVSLEDGTPSVTPDAEDEFASVLLEAVREAVN